MSFKKKSTYFKQECEYDSPDGEKYDISIIRHEERTYIQWGLQSGPDQDKPALITIDGQMLEGLFRVYQDILGIESEPRKRMKAPFVIDHRTKSDNIQTQVDQSMKNFRDDVPPVTSFEKSFDSAAGRSEVQTGVSIYNQEPVEDTPDYIRDQTSGLEEDIQARKLRRPELAKLSAKSNIKKVSASDII